MEFETSQPADQSTQATAVTYIARLGHMVEELNGIEQARHRRRRHRPVALLGGLEQQTVVGINLRFSKTSPSLASDWDQDTSDEVLQHSRITYAELIQHNGGSRWSRQVREDSVETPG